MLDRDLLLNLPEEPGVYLMKDKNHHIIYVGKAKILKNRLKQYFTAVENHTPKVRAMVSNVADFEYIITDSEIEALILECNLIKKHKPYYNILLKDDKHYPYIKITIRDEFPRIMLARKMMKDGAKYYGPYVSSAAVREAIDIVSKLCKLPTCNIRMPRDMGKRKVCLHAHIEQCIAPCARPITQEAYRKLIAYACSFLEGNHSELLQTLTKDMETASEQLEFEKAALLRDKINAIKKIEERQKIISDKQTDEDIVGFYRQDNKTFGEVFFVRRGRLIGRHSMMIDKTGDVTDGALCSEFLKQFYGDCDDIPPRIYTCFVSEEHDLISQWLTGKTGRKTVVKCPIRGEKKKLTDMACKNARQNALDHLLKNSGQNVSKAVLDLKEKLNLSKFPHRIESYDISHTAGSNPVASMVVFKDGKPARSQYRRFKIEEAQGGDDCQSLTEAIYRRFRHARDEMAMDETGTLKQAKFLPLPDLILLDGGKGQVRAIYDLLEKIDMDIPLFGMVKDDKHKTRGVVTAQGEEIDFLKTSQAFRLICSIQEEVHRFAISYHKLLRKKHMIGSVLEEIEGVGPETRKKLIRHFKSVQAIQKASVQSLAEVPGLSAKVSKNIYNFFHEKS
ncbi:MAG: excinuclease ABC subunit UvrC [Ruminococcaceae bacterium]|nr:excinuclease ABC subunit UvrC [Oscillospiraceae bacterium]